MHNKFLLKLSLLVLSTPILSLFAFATTPTLTVTSPANNSQTTSPVNYAATATTNCTKGISAIRVYSAPGVETYTIGGGKLDAYITLPPSTYKTVVVAYDNCGGVATADITVTTTSQKTPGGFLYTVNSDYYNGNTENDVVGFSVVAGNGALAPLLQGSVKSDSDPIAVTSDKGGYRLYVGDYVTGDVFPYFINRSNGYLTPVPGAPFPAGHSVTAVAVHPNGKLIFATRDENATGDGIAVFELQSNGSLKEAPGSPYATKNGPQALVVDPSGKYLYVGDASNYIEAFEINTTTAALTPIAGSPFPLTEPSGCTRGVVPTDILDPVGKFLYTADAFDDSISGFGVGSGGALTQISGSPWADNGGCNVPPDCQQCTFNPYSLAVDGSGKFMYALNSDLEDISIYSISSTGALTYVKDTASSVGCLTPIRTDYTGNYIYTGGCGQGEANGYYRSIAGFSINHTTGDLTPLPTSPFTYKVTSTNAANQSFTVTP